MQHFKKVYIEITRYCGLKCHFCPNAKLDSIESTQMPISLFERVCEAIKGKVRAISLHILGDPLSVRDFALYVEILKAHNLSVELVSTGLFLREQDFDMLLSAPFRQVAFSLSAFLSNPTLLTQAHFERILRLCHYKIMQKSRNFINLRLHSADLAHKNIANLLERLERSFEVSINTESSRIRLGERVVLVIKPFFHWEASLKSSNALDSSNMRDFAFKHCAKPYCYGGLKQFGILHNGALVPCCIDYSGKLSFGNVADSSIAKILESSAFKDFTRHIREGIPPHQLCATCGYREIL